MSDGEGWGGGLPASSKRPVEGDDDSDEPAHKVPKTTAQTTSWFNSSFSVLDQRTSAKVAPVPQAARSARWISPAFSREATPAFVPPVPSTSRSAGGTSTSAAVRPAVASTSTPSRPLQPASQLGRQISLPPSTPTHPTAQRRTGPPAFSLPGKQTRSNERIHNPFATLKQLVPPSAGKTVRSPVTARFGIAGSQQKAPPRPAFAVKSDGSDPTSVDELERGLLPSPIKKGRANPKGGLADHADLIISKQTTANKLWYISEGSASALPDLKVHITSVLSTLPGRTLTHCRMLQGEATFDKGGWRKGIVLFGVGNNKELKEGMTVGIWKPWGDVRTSPLKAPVSLLEEQAPQAVSNGEATIDGSQPIVALEATIDSEDTIVLAEEPLKAAILNAEEKPSSPIPDPGPRALLVTRYLIID